MNNDKDKIPFNDKSQPHGYWEVYWSSDKLWFKRIHNNGKIIGYSEEFNDGGKSSKLTKSYHL